MSTLGDWVAGARLRTLPAAVSPVVAGSGAASWAGSFHLGKALLCLVVALALQVAVNYANDYSDGIRGTDDERRVGPLRLVGSGSASPRAVKLAAFANFGLAGVAGLILTAWSGHWWFLIVGAASILAAWGYTGGKHPYGYAGLGEVFVFVFFGLVAVLGTVYVQADALSLASWCAGVSMGALACAILVANNVRDIRGDVQVGKRTLATRLGDQASRWFFVLLVITALACALLAAAASTWWALLGCLPAPLAIAPVRAMLTGAHGAELIRVLKLTGSTQLAIALSLAAGWTFG